MKFMKCKIYLLSLFILLLVSNVDAGKYFDEVYLARGTSMEPLIKAGDLILTKYYKGEKLYPGDIIYFEDNEGRRYIHRIYSADERGYVTKGDNNKIVDKWVIKERYIFGVVVGLVWSESNVALQPPRTEKKIPVTTYIPPEQKKVAKTTTSKKEKSLFDKILDFFGSVYHKSTEPQLVDNEDGIDSIKTL